MLNKKTQVSRMGAQTGLSYYIKVTYLNIKTVITSGLKLGKIHSKQRAKGPRKQFFVAILIAKKKYR